MEARRCISYASEDRPLQPVEGVDKSALVCCPIISEGDVTGSVLLLNNGQAAPATEVQTKLAQAAAAFLSKQLEE